MSSPLSTIVECSEEINTCEWHPDAFFTEKTASSPASSSVYFTWCGSASRTNVTKLWVLNPDSTAYDPAFSATTSTNGDITVK